MDELHMMAWAMDRMLHPRPMPKEHDRKRDVTPYYEERCGDEVCAHEWRQHNRETGECHVEDCTCPGWV